MSRGTLGGRGQRRAREQHVQRHRALDRMSHWVQGSVGGSAWSNAACI